MKIGVVSDIHSNKTALNKVLNDMPEVDKKICCGDIVGYNGSPSDCLDIVRDKFDIVVMGNHDREVFEKDLDELSMPSRKYAKKELSKDQLSWLSNLPISYNFKNINIYHSHPEYKDKYVYPKDFPRLEKYIEDGEILLLGHTHIMHTYTEDNLIVNPGSVGQPRDGDPRSSYAIIDSEELTVKIKRVSYNIENTKKNIIENNLPEDNYKRLYEGK